MKSPKINVCVPDSDQNDYRLRMSSCFLFNIGKVRHFNTVKNRIRQRSGICGLLTRVYTGVYVGKRLCHYYDNQSHLPLVYGVTRVRYTGLHAVSGLQNPGVRGMSLLETSSFL